MKFTLAIFSGLLFILMCQISDSQTSKEFSRTWDNNHISDKFPSNIRYRDIQKYLDRLEKKWD